MTGDYEVGFKKPPKKHQFGKGVSGNRNGRPKRSQNMDTLIDRELDQVITMKEGGREIRLRKREAIVKRLVNSALTGNPRSIEYLVKYCKDHGAPDPFVITAEDTEAFQAALRRTKPDEEFDE